MPNHHQANPPHERREPVFPARGQSTEPCPSCNLENRLQPTTSAIKRTRIRDIKGCEDCGGTGRVPKSVRPRHHDESDREYRSRVYRDPYEEGAVERVRQRLGALGRTSSPPATRPA